MRNKIYWILLGLLAIGVGLYPLLYLIMDEPEGILLSKSEALLSNVIWKTGFFLHIIPGGIALLVGWTQFSAKIRRDKVHLHRLLGKIYVSAALVSGLAGFSIAWFATGGIVAKIGFALLGFLWFATTLLAYFSILKGDTLRHEKMMIFSYALCFAAVTLRLWLPLLILSIGDFIPAYRIVAWLCWIPNLLFAIVYTGRIKPQRVVAAL